MVYPRRYGSRNYGGGGGFGSSLMGGVEAALYTIAAARDDERKRELDDANFRIKENQIANQREALLQNRTAEFYDATVLNPAISAKVLDSVYDPTSDEVGMFKSAEEFEEFRKNNPGAVQTVMNQIGLTTLDGRNPRGTVYTLEKTPPRQSNDMSTPGGYIAQLPDDTSGLGPGGSYMVSTRNLDNSIGAITKDGSNADAAEVQTWTPDRAWKTFENAVAHAYGASDKGFSFRETNIMKRLLPDIQANMKAGRVYANEQDSLRDEKSIRERAENVKQLVAENNQNILSSTEEKAELTAGIALDTFESEIVNQLKAFDHTEVAEIMNELAGSPDDISKYQLLKGVANQINEAMSAPGALGLTINIPDIDEKYLNVERNPIIEGMKLPETAQEALDLAKKSPPGKVIALDENGKPVVKVAGTEGDQSWVDSLKPDSLAELASLGLMFLPGVGWGVMGAVAVGRTALNAKKIKAIIDKVGPVAKRKLLDLVSKVDETKVSKDLSLGRAEGTSRVFDLGKTLKTSFVTGTVTYGGQKIASAFGDDETTKLPQRIQYFNTLLAADSKELNLDRIQNDREKLEILVDKMSKMPNEEQIRKTQELMTEKNLTSMQRIKEAAENKEITEIELLNTLGVTASVYSKDDPIRTKLIDMFFNVGGTGNPFKSAADVAKVQARQIEAEGRVRTAEIKKEETIEKERLKISKEKEAKAKTFRESAEEFSIKAFSALDAIEIDPGDSAAISNFKTNFRKLNKKFYDFDTETQEWTLAPEYEGRAEEVMTEVMNLAARRMRLIGINREKGFFENIFDWFKINDPGGVALGATLQDNIVPAEGQRGKITKFNLLDPMGKTTDVSFDEEDIRKAFGPRTAVLQVFREQAVINSERRQ